jgi:hypothetical protein
MSAFRWLLWFLPTILQALSHVNHNAYGWGPCIYIRRTQLQKLPRTAICSWTLSLDAVNFRVHLELLHMHPQTGSLGQGHRHGVAKWGWKWGRIMQLNLARSTGVGSHPLLEVDVMQVALFLC